MYFRQATEARSTR